MKKVMTALAVALLSIAVSFAEDKTLTPEVSVYSSVKISGEFRVIHCDSAEPLHIVANEKVLDGIECIVEGDTLNIRYKEGKGAKSVLSGKSPIVSLPANSAVRSITLAGAARLECAVPFTGDGLEFKIHGASRVVGEVALDNLTVKCAGASNVTFTGSAATVRLRIDGACRFAAGEGFNCNDADIDVNGAGVVRISCSGKLSGEVSGASVVRYLGNPEVNVRTNGVSSIKAL